MLAPSVVTPQNQYFPADAERIAVHTRLPQVYWAHYSFWGEIVTEYPCLTVFERGEEGHLQILSPGWRSPPTSSLQHLRRSGELAGGARRRMEVKRDEHLFLSRRTQFV